MSKTTGANVPNGGLNSSNNSNNHQTHHQTQRRRKKRPNYSTRTVEVRRGYNLDFGFTISGQRPCRLACIIPNSPADQAGLRAGDFLISVNGLNVSKLPHETVVQLIGNSFGSIRMQIAENCFSDSSDEDLANAAHLRSLGGNMSLLGASEGAVGGLAMSSLRTKPRYSHHKAKIHRMRNSPQKKKNALQSQAYDQRQNSDTQHFASKLKVPGNQSTQPLKPLIEDIPLVSSNNNNNNSNANSEVKPSAQAQSNGNSNVSPDVSNVSAMVRAVPNSAALEYRACVGYLGTIEMPKQISHSSKLQTVRSCIRKLRQEKRQPTTVLMTILPDCLSLQDSNGKVLATYASARLNYVSSSSESENRFFGLVTSAIHTSQEDDDDEEDDENDDIENENGNFLLRRGLSVARAQQRVISISNSCHVFVIDTKLCEHGAHIQRANEFRIECTRDPISTLCLEFPRHAEYVVNLIRSMYTMRILPPATRQCSLDDAASAAAENAMQQQGHNHGAAHSPQPSNHSEVSTTTSNSDSGIGFHNDFANISDRILVVDFPGVPDLRRRCVFEARNNFQQQQRAAGNAPRPLGICNSIDAAASDKRLTVRAMPDPKRLPPPPPPPLPLDRNARRPDLLANFSLIKSPGAASSLSATRSCDDVLSLVERESPLDAIDLEANIIPPHASMDDITNDDRQQPMFLHPSGAFKRNSRATNEYGYLQDYQSGRRRTSHEFGVPTKLSPQVFTAIQPRQNTEAIHTRQVQINRSSFGQISISDEAHNTSISYSTSTDIRSAASTLFDFDVEVWSSLQNLHAMVQHEYRNNSNHTLEATNSEPDLGNRALPASASPFRRAWGQSSFRNSRTDKHSSPQQRGSPLVRRAASMTASDNDVYVKSMNGNCFVDDLKKNQQVQQQCEQQTTATTSNGGKQHSPGGSTGVTFKTPLPQIKTVDDEVSGVAAWGSSFERLIEDPAGLHTFAEFLKKEFSAENIYFWTACERYRNTENEADRVSQARAIFNKHLGNGALEPVNVDSQARNLTEEKLKNAGRDIFAPAQKQIFNLMKFDSYQRFIRSDLYKRCREAEDKQQQLPYPAETLDEMLRLVCHQQFTANSKLKKTSSNAEDRRRKSLLPWHRKTRSKSRDNTENENGKTNLNSGNSSQQSQHISRLPGLSSSSSLKIPSAHNSMSDVHSSRSSLSSFDALPHISSANTNNPASDITCTLCRIILSDGATTILQVKPEETVGQLVERLLEKRNLNYKFYDVVLNGGSSKSIDLASNAMSSVAGKEVLIEQRVTFKIDLPDPKVISVKSKPKKQLHEVIRPILSKYKYDMNAVEVLFRDSRAHLDLTLPVTVVDGQRLQVVVAAQNMSTLLHGHHSNGHSAHNSKFIKPLSVSKSSECVMARNGLQQNSLDEITNKVFSELLQEKVEAQDKHDKQQQQMDHCSIKSDDCTSETSSIFDRLRKRDSIIPPVLKTRSKKKSASSQHSEETTCLSSISMIVPPAATATTTITTTNNTNACTDIKKPLIAKLKAGVKLQVTERVADSQDELLEGIKRAQLSRLEDQRGTEITIELPDFLKNKENEDSAAARLRKIRANLSPINTKPNGISTSTIISQEKLSTPTKMVSLSTPTTPLDQRPQPAPRLSITNRNKSNSISPMRIDEEEISKPTRAVSTPTTPTRTMLNISKSASESNASRIMEQSFESTKSPPPPLPPKPKVLPIRPSNWGVTATSPPLTLNQNYNECSNQHSTKSFTHSELKSPIKSSAPIVTKRCAYLEATSSNFV